MERKVQANTAKTAAAKVAKAIKKTATKRVNKAAKNPTKKNLKLDYLKSLITLKVADIRYTLKSVNGQQQDGTNLNDANLSKYGKIRVIE